MEIVEEYKNKNFSKLEKEIGIKFNNPNYLVQALVHRSFLNENPELSIAELMQIDNYQEILNSSKYKP